MPDGDAAAMVLRGIVDESFADRARKVPEGAAGAGVDGVDVVGSADEKNAVDGDGRDFEVAGGLDMKHPFGAQLGDVCGGDLAQAGKAAARIIAIVGRPIGRGWRNAQIVGRNIYLSGNWRCAVLRWCDGGRLG